MAEQFHSDTTCGNFVPLLNGGNPDYCGYCGLRKKEGRKVAKDILGKEVVVGDTVQVGGVAEVLNVLSDKGGPVYLLVMLAGKFPVCVPATCCTVLDEEKLKQETMK